VPVATDPVKAMETSSEAQKVLIYEAVTLLKAEQTHVLC
jgi:hypothetical protein